MSKLNAIRDVFVCLNCNTGIYARVANETDITCSCEACTIQGTASQSYSNAEIITTKIEPEEGIEYLEFKNVPLRITDAVLIDDYNEFRDRFGVIRNATKTIPILYNMEGKDMVYQERRYFQDFVSDFIEDDIEERLTLKESDIII